MRLPCLSVRLSLSILLVVTIVALSFLFRFWQEQSRPGVRHYHRGMAHLEAGDALEAEREWLLGTAQDPTDYRCHKQLGDYYAQLRRFVEARDCYASAVRRAPHKWILFLRLAAAEKQLGHLDAATAAARRAYMLRPDHADAAGLYGLLLAESQNRPAALNVLRQAHQLRPGDYSYFFAMVKTELESMEFASVERDLAPYLRSHPGDAEACFMMATAYNQKPRTPRNLETAIDLARKALAGLPNDARVYALLGQLYLDAGRTREALQVGMAGRRAAPHSEGVLRVLIDSYTRLGRTADAAGVSWMFQRVLARHDRIAHLSYVVGSNHRDTTAGLELARLVEEDGRCSQARKIYELLVRQSPADPRTRRALSGFYRRMGWTDRARLAFDRRFVP